MKKKIYNFDQAIFYCCDHANAFSITSMSREKTFSPLSLSQIPQSAQSDPLQWPSVFTAFWDFVFFQLSRIGLNAKQTISFSRQQSTKKNLGRINTWNQSNFNRNKNHMSQFHRSKTELTEHFEALIILSVQAKWLGNWTIANCVNHVRSQSFIVHFGHFQFFRFPNVNASKMANISNNSP